MTHNLKTKIKMKKFTNYKLSYLFSALLLMLLTGKIVAANCTASFTYTNNATGKFNFVANTSGHYAGTNYTWLISGAGSYQGGYGSNYNHQFLANGTYSVKLVTLYIFNDSLNPANSIYCKDSVMKTVTVTGVIAPACKAQFTMFNADTVSQSSQTWYVINNSFGKPTITYLWEFGDGTTSTLEFPSHTYANPGHYDVCLTIKDGAGCTSKHCDTSSVHKMAVGGNMKYLKVVGNTASINKIQNEHSFNIFPNPFTDKITIQYAALSSRNISVEVYDVMGKVVYTENKYSNVGQNQLEINAGDLSRGLYYIKVYAEEKNLINTLKVVK